MENISLKYLIIGVISLSILIIVGAFTFSRIDINNSNQSIEKQTSQENKQPAGPKGGIAPSEGGEPLSTPIPIKQN